MLKIHEGSGDYRGQYLGGVNKTLNISFSYFLKKKKMGPFLKERNFTEMWRKEEPSMLQSIGWQRVGHDLVTEQ